LMPMAPTAADCSTTRRLRLVFKRSVITALLSKKQKNKNKKGVLTAYQRCQGQVLRTGGDAFVRF